MLRREYRFDAPAPYVPQIDHEKALARWRRKRLANPALHAARTTDWKRRNPDKVKAQREREKARRIAARAARKGVSHG